ncbi:MAG: WD40 repeat domain-containing protein [Planctomyces sp.]|nr:WD40 repeat domain-containing protein [Planctomyces sp.]
MPGLKTAQRGGSEVIQLWQADVDDFVQDLAWSSDHRFLAAISISGSLAVFASDGSEYWKPTPHSHAGSSVAWRPGTSEFSSIGHDGVVRHWDAHKKALIWEAESGALWGTRVAWRPNGSMLASAAGRILRLWNPEGVVQRESADHESTITDLGWNPDGSSVAVSAYFGVTLHILGKSTRKFQWKGSSLVLSWSPTSRFLVTGEQDSSVHVWYVKTGNDSQMSGFATKVRELAWHHTGNFLATGGSDSIVLWDCSGKGPEGKTPRILEAHASRITQLAFQFSGDQLASSDTDGIVMLWKPLSDVSPYFFHGLNSEISRLVWTSNDQRLTAGESCGKITTFGFRK